MALEFTDANFAELTNTDKPVLVDFWAVWCGPCKMVGPHVEALYNEYEGKALVGKVDVDNNQELAGKFGIRNIPTLVVIKNGEVVEKLVGAVSKQAIEEKLAAHV